MHKYIRIIFFKLIFFLSWKTDCFFIRIFHVTRFLILSDISYMNQMPLTQPFHVTIQEGHYSPHIPYVRVQIVEQFAIVTICEPLEQSIYCITHIIQFGCTKMPFFNLVISIRYARKHKVCINQLTFYSHNAHNLRLIQMLLLPP